MFYPGYVAGELQESPHAVGLELSHLQAGGILNKVKMGSHTYYQWNETFPFASILYQTIEKMRGMGDSIMVQIPCMARKRQIEGNLSRVVLDIKQYYQPERIVLFGSAVSGKIGPYSDIDLVVVKETSLPYFKRVQQLVDLLNYDVDIDFLVYTPREFSQALKQNRFFREEIIKKGKVLYDRAA
ncbi:MAG: nucleotidyltransferase domain-containing protein [Chlamydiae bacterium]|nr:nucleotidyltransferase domain-containing protein [Chlamydiota bacterium]